MKITNIMFVFVFLAATSVIGFGQLIDSRKASAETSSPEMIKAKIERTTGIVDARPEAAKLRAADDFKIGSAPGPGDRAVYLLHANRNFVRRGETLELNLVPIINSKDIHNVGIQVLKSGMDGEFDGTIPPGYFPAETPYGMIRGTDVLSNIRIHTRMFNQEDNFGRHTFNIVIWDEQGTLVQQILFDVYLVNAGAYGRWFYADKVNQTQVGLNLVGKFPVGVPIFYMIGVPDYGTLITGPDPQYAAYATHNGRRVFLYGNIGFFRSVSTDIMMWSPGTRYAVAVPKGFVDGPPSQ